MSTFQEGPPPPNHTLITPDSISLTFNLPFLSSPQKFERKYPIQDDRWTREARRLDIEHTLKCTPLNCILAPRSRPLVLAGLGLVMMMTTMAMLMILGGGGLIWWIM